MIVRKASAVGTLYEQIREMQMRLLREKVFPNLAFADLLEVRCRIKSPVPNPLSTAVKAALTRSDK